MMDAEFEELVRAAQSGDRAAQGALYEQFQGSVQAIAFRRIGDWEEARELTQDVFIQAFRRLGQLEVPAAFAGWLRRIAHRMAINRAMRSRFPSLVEAETLDRQSEEDESPLESLLREEQKAQVREGMSRLRRLDRETLEAFYWRGQSLNEMSDTFRAPVGTIKRRLHVARRRLAEEVELVAQAR